MVWQSMCVGVLSALVATAQLKPLQPKTASSLTGLASATAAQSGVPSEAEISAFQTECANPANAAEKLVFLADLRPQKITAELRKKYAFNGRVPFRLTVELLRYASDGGGRAKGRVLEGSCAIVLVDASGAVIKRTKESMANLCPS